MDIIARSIMLRRAGSLAALVSLVYLTRNLLWAAAGSLIVRCVVLLAHDASKATFWIERANAGSGRTLAERLRPRWNLRKQLQLAWIAPPLGGLSF
jgi:hypothetical protein